MIEAELYHDRNNDMCDEPIPDQYIEDLWDLELDGPLFGPEFIEKEGSNGNCNCNIGNN